MTYNVATFTTSKLSCHAIWAKRLRACSDVGLYPARRSSSHAIKSQSTYLDNSLIRASDLSLTPHIVTFPGIEGWVGVKNLSLRVGWPFREGGLRVGCSFEGGLEGGLDVSLTCPEGGLDLSRPIIRKVPRYRTPSLESALSDPEPYRTHSPRYRNHDRGRLSDGP